MAQLFCPLVFCLGRVVVYQRESIRVVNFENDATGESSIGLNVH